VVLLTVFHYAMTWLGIAFCVVMGWLKTKKIDTRQIALFAVGFAMGVPFCNASLRINTVGTYQVSKRAVSLVKMLIFTNYPIDHESASIACVGNNTNGVVWPKVRFQSRNLFVN